MIRVKESLNEEKDFLNFNLYDLYTLAAVIDPIDSVSLCKGCCSKYL